MGMLGLIPRFRNLVQNAIILAPFFGGPHKSFAYILRTRGRHAAIAQGRYKGINFKFRRGDVPALKEIFFKEEYGGFLEEIIKGKDRPVILDIGAHIGLFAIWVFARNPKARIHSVEASPGTYQILSENAKNNNFEWRTENRAAWGKNELIRFADESSSTMSHRVDRRGDIEIEAVTMADLVAGKNIDLMKVDIEGAEESFLTAEGVNLDNVQNLVIELHPEHCNAQKVKDVLERNFKTIEDMKAGTTAKPLLFCRK